MKNAIIAALVSALVAVCVSGADTPLPVARPYSPPSAADVNKAQTREITKLKNEQAAQAKNEAMLYKTLQSVIDTLNCVDGAYSISESPDGTLHYTTSDDDPESIGMVASFDPECTS